MEQPPARRFAEALRSERERHGLSRRELGGRLRLREAVIDFWEDPDRLRRPPIQELVLALERVIGVGNGALQVAAGYAPVSGSEVAARAEQRLAVIAQQLRQLELEDDEVDALLELIRVMGD